MKKLLDSTNLFFEKVPATVREWRYVVWSVFILLTIFLAMGVPKIKIDASVESFFSENDSAKQIYNRFRTLFEGDEALYIVYEAKDGDIFSEQSLRTLLELHNDLFNYHKKIIAGEVSSLDHITEVRSLINAQYLEVNADNLMSRNFIGSKIPTTKDERELLRKQAIEHPDFAPLFFSRDFKYGGIIVRTDFNGVPEEYNQNKDNSNLDIFEEDESFEDFEPIQNNENFSGDEYQPTFKITAMPEYSLFMKEINKILDNPKYLNELTFFPVGPPAIYSFYYDVVLPQMSMIMLGALIIIAVVLLFLFRAISAVVWSIFIIVLSIICTLGIIGWTGVVMNQMIQVVLFLIITIGVADTVHILSGYVYFRNLNQNHEIALKSVFKKSGLACFLTSLTTAVGLISLIFVPIVPIKNFGIFSATGVFIAFIFTIFLLPLMLNLWAPVSKIEKKKRFKRKRRVFIQNILQNLEGYSIRYSKEIICLFFSMMIILLFGAYQVHVNYDIVKVLKDKAPIRNFYDIVDREMAGSGNMEILIETGKIYGMQDPSILNAMEALQNYMETKHQDIIKDTSSLVNVAKYSFQLLNEDRKEMYRIPQDPHVLRQTLFLFNNANPRDRRLVVTDDYSAGRINFNVSNLGSALAKQLFDDVSTQTNQIFAPLKTKYPKLKVSITGSMAMLARISDFISWSQIKSFSLAIGAISVIFLLIFGSPLIGLIAVIPNIFPIITICGIMGFFKIHMDADILLVIPITIGIAVDDTIHFLTHYRLELKDRNIPSAIIATIREVGQAVVFTSVILSAGFLLFMISSHNGLSNFGILSAVAMMSALLSDLFLLPALCTVFNLNSKK